MKSSELRRPNLIMFEGLVVTVAETRILEEDDELDERFQPIPLTEEWLLKLGFEGASGAYSLERDGETILSVDTLYNKWFVGRLDEGEVIKSPEYVHQLQNLYHALTGEELTIKEI